MRTMLFGALAALVLTAAPAHAGGAPNYPKVRKVLEAAGLMGRWGVDCDAPAGSTEWETIEVTDKGIVQSVEGGDDVISTYYITEARRLSATEVRMKLLYIPEGGTDAEDDDIPGGENATTVVYRVEANRQMTWTSIGPDGAPLITDGAFIDSDEHSKWYNRCPAERAAQ
jgi:hypothetical protein